MTRAAKISHSVDSAIMTRILSHRPTTLGHILFYFVLYPLQTFLPCVNGITFKYHFPVAGQTEVRLLHLYAHCSRHHGVAYHHLAPACSPLHLLLLRPWPHRSSRDYRLHEEESNLGRRENSKPYFFKHVYSRLLQAHSCLFCYLIPFQ